MITVEVWAEDNHVYLVTGVSSKEEAERAFKDSFMDTKAPAINAVRVYNDPTVWFLG